MTRGFRKLRVPDDVAALIRNLHPDLKRKVRAGVEAILAEPQSGKPLKDELAGLRSFRIGKFRLIYRLRSRDVELVALGSRERIYEETYRIITKTGRGGGVNEAPGRYRVKRRARKH